METKQMTPKDIIRAVIIKTTPKTVIVESVLFEDGVLKNTSKEEAKNILIEILSTEKEFITILKVQDKPIEFRKPNNLQSKAVTVKIVNGNGYIEESFKISLN